MVESIVTALPATREEALSLSLTRYFDGKPCKKGHIAPRYSANQTCSTCAHTSAQLRRKNHPSASWIGNVVCGTRKRAREGNLPFDLTSDYVRSIMVEHFPVLNYKLAYHSNGTGCSQHNTATLDRLVPKLGYVQGNVEVISLRANLIKSDAALSEIQAVARWLETTLAQKGLLDLEKIDG